MTDVASHQPWLAPHIYARHPVYSLPETVFPQYYKNLQLFSNPTFESVLLPIYTSDVNKLCKN